MATKTVMGSERPRLTSIERSNIRYWLMAFLLLIALATATSLLYVSAIETLKSTSSTMLESRGALILGLAGLVTLFCLYMLQRQLDLARLRSRLFNEKVKTETLKTQLMELSALFDVGTAINLRLRLDGIIRIIVRRLPSCLAADRASLMIVNPSTGLLECRAAWGHGSEKTQNYTVRMGEGISGWVAANGRPLLLHGRELGRFTAFAKYDDEISSAMSVPIKLKNSTVGVLNVTRVQSTERFRRQHMRLLCSFAANVAGVIRKAYLYDKVDARKMLLEDTNKELTSLNQMKEVFLATLSHELRTPLTCIVSFAELLDEKSSQISEADRKKFISLMHEQASKLLDLTEQLMDLSKLEKGSLKLKLKPTDVNEVVRSAYVALEPAAKCRDIDVRLELDPELPPIPADPTKVRQILLNLTGNAIKFTDEGGTVVMGTRCCGEDVELSVRDTGVGLDSNEIERIFGLFTQGSQPGQGCHHGLGLGLYLVKGFVELHKGRVTVESQKGSGTTFRVYLPTAQKGRETCEPDQHHEELATPTRMRSG
ncbi:MAG: GAF domain-containing sensor histidine kinase [Candidatus Eisenbacteria bacterium]